MLISPISLQGPDWAGSRLWVNLTKERGKNSPGIDLDRPVSRQYEVDYFNYSGWPYYRPGPYASGAWAYPAALARSTRPASTTVAEVERGDPHRRSNREVTGYHSQATDDAIGHVEDFIVDIERCQICSLVVDTRDWWFGKNGADLAHMGGPREPGGAQGICGPQTRAGQAGPEWDPSQPVNRASAARLCDHYGRPASWSCC